MMNGPPRRDLLASKDPGDLSSDILVEGVGDYCDINVPTTRDLAG